MKGLIFDIKKFALHDGPGIRTTVFLKGCPLNCLWCHNPESRCFDTESYIRVDKLDGKSFNKQKTIGNWMTVEEVIIEIEKDKMFYEESNGGVTFSGGEPFAQYEFLTGLLIVCRKKNIHTTVDTTGYIKREQLNKIHKLVDLFLYDLKHMDDKLHKKYTGVSNKLIIENLKWLSNRKSNIKIRFPVVPGYNDSEKNIDLMRFLLENLYPDVRHIDLLPYHKMAGSKAKRLGLKQQVGGIEEPDARKLGYIRKKFEEIGFTVGIGG
ncbi:MAG: glycyl-radical enzyme activating protein [Bacteroidales bacterium]|nr:glycyl-radical enzyme activating protein [Bacteroidales bacterium]